MIDTSHENPLALKFQLTMLSDWHVGSGYGRPGDVNALVTRDADGLPYVPAKTLTGILRDACEQTAFGLDEGKKDGAWSAWVGYIFGSQPAVDGRLQRPVPAALSVRSACFSEAVRGQLDPALCGGTQLAEALRTVVTFTKPGVKLKIETGQAEEDCLRMEEMVRGGTVLDADALMQLTGLSADQQHCALGLLAAGCRLAERIGGKRRRGGGRMEIHMSLPQETEQDLIDWLATHSADVPAPPHGGAAVRSPTLTGVHHPATWSSYDVTLSLNSQVVAASAKKGNVVESLDYLPGTYLLPVVSGILRKMGVDADGAIVNGDVTVSNATIDVGGTRGLPVPWALFREKLSKGEVNEEWNTLRKPLDRQRQFKGLRTGYVASDGKTLTHKKVQMSVRMHNSIDDGRQRPDESVGGVYTYTAISAGQTFHTRIRVSQEIPLPNGWEKELTGVRVRLGSSKKDDYGVALITDVHPVTEEEVTEEKPTASSEYLTVWLTSDVLLRDERLHPAVTPRALQDVLEHQLDCKLGPLHPDDVANAPMNRVGRRRRTDSWQTSWGLPRPSLLGLCAGTCFVYGVTDIADMKNFSAALARIQAEGIGERRAEGYGQVLFNHPVLDHEVVTFAEESNTKRVTKGREAIPPNQQEERYLKVLRSAALTAAIRRAAATLAADAKKRREALGISDEKPTDSQLGNLLAIASTVKKPNDSMVMAWLTHKGDAKNLMADKLGNDAKEKLAALFKEPDTVWTLLSRQGDWRMEQLLKDKGNDRDDSTWAEGVQTLLDQCIRFEKRDRERLRGGTK